MDGHDRDEPRPWVILPRSRSRSSSTSSSSSSSSSDGSSFSLPSVKLLASKFSSLDKKATAPKPQQSKPQPTSTSNKTAVGGQRIQSAPSSKITTPSLNSGGKLAYSNNKPNYNSLPTKPKQVVVTNGRGPSFDDEDDDVFYNSVPNNQRVPLSKVALRKTSSSSVADSDLSTVAADSSWSRYQQQRRPDDQSYERDSREVFTSNRSSLSSVSADSPKHNVIFGVPLRRLDTISWGVKQRRVPSNKSDSDSSSSDDSRPPTPTPSPAPLDAGSKFSTFPKRTQPSVEDHSLKASTMVKKGSGGVKSKIATKLGDKSSPKYHSQSDLSSAAAAAALATWRRKSVSDDAYELQHQPLARRQSISGLLKLYRTKSQSDLMQIGDGGSTLPINHQSQKEEPQAKAKAVSAPLKMSDLKIVNPMAKPKVVPYKHATKDIVRLPSSQHATVTKSLSMPAFVTKTTVNNRQVLSSTSSTSDSESDRSKVVSPPPQQRPKSVQYISRPQHFNRPQVLTKPNSTPAKPPLIIVKTSKPATFAANTPKPVIVASIKPTPTTSNKPAVKEVKPAPSLKPAPPQKSSNAMKLTRMLTPPSYPGYSEPNIIRNQSASNRSSSSSSSSSSDSDDEIPRKLQESISKQKITAPVVHSSPVSAIISSLNSGTGKPVYPPKPRIASWKTYDSSDEVDGIPHDDKMPSFIVPLQAKKNVIVITKINGDKSSTTNKPEWKLASQGVRPNKLVSDDTDGIPHDEKVPSFVVTKPAQKVVINQSHRFEQKKEPSVKFTPSSPLTKSWPPETKARSNSSSSDSTIKDLSEGHNSPKVSVPSSRANFQQTYSSSSSSSDSDSSDDETQQKALNVKTGFYEVNKEISSVGNEKKVAIRITRKSSSDSTEEERKNVSLVKIESQIKEPRLVAATQAKVSVLPQDNDKIGPKPSNIPKPTVTSGSAKKLVLQGDSFPAVINKRPEPTKTSFSKSSSSSDDSASPKPTKIPIFKTFVRKDSSTSDEDVKLKVKQIAKPLEKPKPPQTTSSTKESSPKSDKLDRNKDARRSGSSNSGGEQFEGFDPYAISRMIVRGSRKSDSHVKKPEHLTNIMNATIPVHSPFSPLKAANAKKPEPEAPIKEESLTRRASTSSSSSSSSSSSGSLDFLNDGDHEGVYSANVVIVD